MTDIFMRICHKCQRYFYLSYLLAYVMTAILMQIGQCMSSCMYHVCHSVGTASLTATLGVIDFSQHIELE